MLQPPSAADFNFAFELELKGDLGGGVTLGKDGASRLRRWRARTIIIIISDIVKTFQSRLEWVGVLRDAQLGTSKVDEVDWHAGLS